MRKRQAMLLLFCVILLLSGLGLLLYPSVNAWLEEGRIHQDVQNFPGCRSSGGCRYCAAAHVIRHIYYRAYRRSDDTLSRTF